MAQQLASNRVERLTLLHHGTQPVKLSPRAIVQTAEADLRHRDANREIRRLRANGTPAQATGKLYQYCFHSKHLKSSTTAAALIKKAIAGLSDGAGSSEIGRAIIYSDADLLWEALRLAEGD